MDTSMLENFWKSIKPHLFWIATIFGMVLIAWGYLIKDPANQSVESQGLIHTGTTVLVSGVFGSMLKSFQFSNLFKEELDKLFSSVDFTEKLRRIAVFGHDEKNIFDRIMEHAIGEKHPSIASKIPSSIKRFLRADYDYYHSEYSRHITIRSYDKNSGLISLDDDFSFQVHPVKDCVCSASLQGIHYEEGAYEIKVLTVCKDIESAQDILTAVDKKIPGKLSYQFEVKSGVVYTVRRVISTSYMLLKDPIIFQQFKRVCDNLKLEILNEVPDLISVDVTFINFSDQPAPSVFKKHPNQPTHSYTSRIWDMKVKSLGNEAPSPRARGNARSPGSERRARRARACL